MIQTIIMFMYAYRSLFLSLQPFWPEGVGIAHGYFSVFDTVWMMYEWLGLQLPANEVLQNRKDTYVCLKEITKGNMVAVRDYGIDPLKRYAKYRDMKSREGTAILPMFCLVASVTTYFSEIHDLKRVQNWACNQINSIKL